MNWASCRWAAVIFAFALTACGVNPVSAPELPATRTFADLDCAGLDAERLRIEGTFRELRWSSKPVTRRIFGQLKGDARAVDDQIRMKNCQIPSVRIPGESRHAEEDRDKLLGIK